MNTKTLIPLVLSSAAVWAAGVLPAPAAAATDVQQAASENWSGYVASPTTSSRRFTSVSGSWTQPAANCASGSGYAAFWVGLGGSGAGSGSSEALEQAGTEADCSSSGQASYFAWYELVPSAPVKLGLTVKPGDHMSTRVRVSGSTVTINLADQTSGQSVTKVLTMSNPDTSSAEWIAEAPSSCQAGASNCTPLPLADFGTVRFTGASATSSDGHTGGVTDPEWTATQVALQSGAGGPQFAADTSAASAGATPTSLGGDQRSFAVAWSDAASAATGSTDPTGAGGGYGGGGYGYDGSGYGGYGYGDGGGGYVIVVPGGAAGAY